MADVKVPKLLHKMSVSAQKAWYKKHGMEMPSSEEGKSAAQAKKVKVVKKVAAPVKPQSIRDINAARQKAYYEKGGRAPIGAGGSGGHSSMAGVDQSTIRGIKAGIKAGINPKVALVRYTEEVSKKEAEAVIGGPTKEKPKMPPGKQPAGYRYVRNLARKAMKAGLKEAVKTANPGFGYHGEHPADKADAEYSKMHAKLLKTAVAGNSSSKKIRNYLDSTHGRHLAGRENDSEYIAKDFAKFDKNYRPEKFKEEVEQVNEMHSQGYRGYRRDQDPVGKGPAKYVKPEPTEKTKKDALKLLNKSFTKKQTKEEVELDETKKPDASMAMTHQLKMKMISDKDKRTLGKVADLMAAQKKKDKPVKEETEESTMQYIEEKLTAADPASKWISDFVKSDNPKFAGKSKKERIQQALGAYYAAKGRKNEELEFLESKKMEKEDEKEEEDYEEKDEMDDEEDDDEEEIDEAAKDWKKAFSNVAQKNLKKDIGKIRSKVGRLNYIGMQPAVDATPKVTAAATKKGSYSEEVEQVDEVTGYEGVKDRTDMIKRAAAMNRMGKQTFLDRVKTRAAEIRKEKAKKKLAKEEVEGKDPETSTEIALAKKHGNPKKITYGDVVKARIEASKKKAVKGE